MRTMPNYLPDEDNLLDGASLKSWLVYHCAHFLMRNGLLLPLFFEASSDPFRHWDARFKWIRIVELLGCLFCYRLKQFHYLQQSVFGVVFVVVSRCIAQAFQHAWVCPFFQEASTEPCVVVPALACASMPCYHLKQQTLHVTIQTRLSPPQLATAQMLGREHGMVQEVVDDFKEFVFCRRLRSWGFG